MSTKFLGIPIVWPVPSYTKVSSTYGYRIHPIYKVRKLHTGVDLSAPANTNCLAAMAGTVTFAGWYGGYGNAVIIDHGKGISTLYGHNNSIKVKVGQKVLAGTIIALIGSTGNSTGPHCHFEIRINGTPRIEVNDAIDDMIANGDSNIVGFDGYAFNAIGSEKSIKMTSCEVFNATGHSLTYKVQLEGYPLSINDGLGNASEASLSIGEALVAALTGKDIGTPEDEDGIGMSEKIILFIGGKVGEKSTYQLDITKEFLASLNETSDRNKGYFHFIISNLQELRNSSFEFKNNFYISWYLDEDDEEPVFTFPSDDEGVDSSQKNSNGVTFYGYLHPNDEISSESSYDKDVNRGFKDFRNISSGQIIGSNYHSDWVGQISVEKINNLINYCTDYHRWHYQLDALKQIDRDAIYNDYFNNCKVYQGEPISAIKYNNFIDMIESANEKGTKKFNEDDYYSLNRVVSGQLIKATLFSENLAKNGLPNCNPSEDIDKKLWMLNNSTDNANKSIKKGSGIAVSGGAFISTTASSNANLIWKLLRKNGLGEAAAAGVMGNMSWECGDHGSFQFLQKNIEIVEGGDKNLNTPKKGYGLCQWTVEGKTPKQLKAIIGTTITQQIAYLFSPGQIQQQMNNSTYINNYNRVISGALYKNKMNYNFFRSLPSSEANAADAALAFCKIFERGDWVEQRRTYAKAAYKLYAGKDLESL